MRDGGLGGRAFHPFLFAAFPILYLARVNLWSITLREVLPPLALTLAALAVLYLLGRRFWDARRVAIVLSALALLFFSYGHIWALLFEKEIGGIIVGRDKVLVPLWMALFIGTVAVAWKLRALNGATRVLNAVGLALVLTTGAPVAIHLTTVNSASAGPSALLSGELDAAPGDPPSRPDIYFLVFDRYAGAQTIYDRFGYDNTPFLGFLESKGFAVACSSRANYENTTKSLAASLNLDYVDRISQRAGRDEQSLVPFYAAIRDNAAARFLRSRGYRYIHIGNWWDPTNENPQADVNHRLDAPSGFTRALYTSSALWPAARRGHIGSVQIGREELHRSVGLRQLEILDSVVSEPGPKFVFAHVLLPHPPYVFAADGSLMTHDDRVALKGAGGWPYIEQLRYLNRRLSRFVDELLSAGRERSTVVVIQADEGPFLHDLDIPRSIDLRTSTDEELRMKYRIPSAFHLPGVPGGAVHPQISPVNVFRLVFDEYMGTDLGLLSDRAFLSPRDRPHELVEITERLREPRSREAESAEEVSRSSCSLAPRVASD